MTLAEQIEALCDQHDLTALSIHYHRYTSGSTGFTAYAHGRDVLGSNNSAPTPHQAISEAIATLNARRHAVEGVPQLEAA